MCTYLPNKGSRQSPHLMLCTEKELHNLSLNFEFPHLCVCERFLYSHDQSAYFAAGKYVDRSWEYINCSQTHKCWNWDWGRSIPFLGIHKWDFLCSVKHKVKTTDIHLIPHWLLLTRRTHNAISTLILPTIFLFLPSIVKSQNARDVSIA